MFLCGQVTNFLVVLIFFGGATVGAADSPEMQSMLDFLRAKRRRQVCNLDNAA